MHAGVQHVHLAAWHTSTCMPEHALGMHRLGCKSDMRRPLAAGLPQTPDHLKTPTAEEAFNKNGLSQRTIRLLKDAFPDLEVSAAGRGGGDQHMKPARSDEQWCGMFGVLALVAALPHCELA